MGNRMAEMQLRCWEEIQQRFDYRRRGQSRTIVLCNGLLPVRLHAKK